MEDNSIQMKKDLATFLYQLRIPTDISAYTYERTLIMEQCNDMFQMMKMSEKQKRGDAQHLLARSFSTQQMSIPTHADHLATPTSPPGEISIPLPEWPRVRPSVSAHSTHSAASTHTTTSPLSHTATMEEVDTISVENLRRMNTSVKLNELIVQKSHDASLVIVNLPGPPRNTADEENYMEFLDVLTEGLERVLMVRGGGREVITLYS